MKPGQHAEDQWTPERRERAPAWQHWLWLTLLASPLLAVIVAVLLDFLRRAPGR